MCLIRKENIPPRKKMKIIVHTNLRIKASLYKMFYTNDFEGKIPVKLYKNLFIPLLKKKLQ